MTGADGHTGRYPHEVLRGYCPCAACQGHGGPIRWIETRDHQCELDTIETVGGYALALKWSMGMRAESTLMRFSARSANAQRAMRASTATCRGCSGVTSEAGDPSAHRDAARVGDRERRRLLGRAAVVGGGTLFSRLLGLMRDVTLAAVFDREATDAWWVAFTIPNAMRSLLGEGAVTSTVVPLLTKKLETEGEVAGRRFFARVRGASLVALVAVTALGMLLARPLTATVRCGLPIPPGRARTHRRADSCCLPIHLLHGNRRARDGRPQCQASLWRRCVRARSPQRGADCVRASASRDVRGPPDHPILALAVGALAGGALQVFAQLPALRAIGYSSPPQFVLDADVRRVLRRLVPLTFGIGVYYVDSCCRGGSSPVSHRVLRAISRGPCASATSRKASSSWPCRPPRCRPSRLLQRRGIDSRWRRRGRMGWASLSSSRFLRAFSAALGEPIVVALFQRGAFDALSARETARALFWQGSAVWTVAAVRQTVPALYAMGDTRTPVVVSAIDLMAFIALALGLRASMGHAGISAAVAGSSAVQMLLLIAGLKWRLGTICVRTLTRSAIRTSGAALIAGLAGVETVHVVAHWAGRDPSLRAVPGVVAVSVYVVVFLGMAWAFRAPEFFEIAGAVARRGRLGR